MSEEFTLNYHAATIQHLGIGLYKQLPQAIAELITNSWDADSHNVQININYKEKIEIKSLKKGECLFFVGRDHILTKINSDDYEKELIE